MWEEPRPERVPKEESTQEKVIIWLIRLLILAGLAAIVFNAIQRQQIRTPAPPAAIPESRVPAQPSEARGSTVPPSSPVPLPRRETPRPREAPRADPAVLAALTDTCRYWTAENTRGQFEGHQQTACQQMVRYAREFGMAVPSIGGSIPERASTTRGSTSSINVHVDECEHLRYGSIAYRQCRATEKRRLTESCSSLRAQREAARGEHYQNLSRTMQAVCSTADRYQIVR